MEGVENRVQSREALAILEQAGFSCTIHQIAKGARLFSQGTSHDVLYYLLKGRVKLSVVSGQGKEAIIRVVSDGDIFGEWCLGPPALSALTATALTPCSGMLLPGPQVRTAARKNPALAELIIRFLLLHNRRIQDELANQLTNPSERRLAYVLAVLADSSENHAVEGISQEDLACMIGTTRSRISFFMNRFRRLGCIEFADRTKSFRVVPSRIKEMLQA